MRKRFLPYVSCAEEAGQRHGVDPWLILAVIDRESTCGLTLKPLGSGPAGTGDWLPRRWGRYGSAYWAMRLRHWMPTAEEWADFCDKGTRRMKDVPEELCRPVDGLGWGRGLMQLDFGDIANQPFLEDKLVDGTFAWMNAAQNIDAGTAKLAALIRHFNGNEGLACAAYNAGIEAVNRAIHELTMPASPDKLQRAADFVTTGKNYGGDVLARRALIRMQVETKATMQPKE